MFFGIRGWGADRVAAALRAVRVVSIHAAAGGGGGGGCGPTDIDTRPLPGRQDLASRVARLGRAGVRRRVAGRGGPRTLNPKPMRKSALYRRVRMPSGWRSTRCICRALSAG